MSGDTVHSGAPQPIQRLQELLGTEAAPSAVALADHIHHESPLLDAELIRTQLEGGVPLDRSTNDELARHFGLELAADWLYAFLTDGSGESELAHVRTVRKLINSGHTWRRITRD